MSQLPRSQAAGSSPRAVAAQAGANGVANYDLVIIGCGVGGHGAALHAVEQVSDAGSRLA